MSYNELELILGC